MTGKLVVELGAVASIVQVYEAGEPSVLPAASVARTSKVCEPSATPLYAFGEVQAANEPPSSLHSKVEPPSLDVNEKLGESLFDGSPGCAVIVVFGPGRWSLDGWLARGTESADAVVGATLTQAHR